MQNKLMLPKEMEGVLQMGEKKNKNLLTIYLGFETHLLNIIACFNNRLGLKKMKGTRRFES